MAHLLSDYLLHGAELAQGGGFGEEEQGIFLCLLWAVSFTAFWNVEDRPVVKSGYKD